MPVSRPHLATLVQEFERLGTDFAAVSPRGVRLQTISYGRLAQLSRRFGAELERREIRKGDRVILCGENGSDWVAAFFGCVLRGVLPVPIDAASPNTFLDRIIGEVSPRLLLTSGEREFNSVQALGFHSLSEVITDREAQAIPELSADDALQIIFTSGTTGSPKGVVHTHGNVLASLQPIENEFERYRKYERPFHPIRVLHTLPLSHVFGQFMGLWVPPVVGLEVHYRSRLVGAELIAYIRRHRISVLAAVPRVVDLVAEELLRSVPQLAERIRKAGGLNAAGRWWHFRDVHRLLGWKFWALVCGGAALSARSEQFWHSLGFVVIQGYGMTETTALVSLNHPFKPARGTVGQVLPGREVRLGDDGEVFVRGETISGTTWQGGAMHAADSEWLATGDLAEFDAGGNLHFRGRKKDVIVTAAGLNIHPEDLEEALMHQHGIRSAAVIETESASGPEPLAVLLAATEAAAETAVAAANQSLAEFQKISRWLVWPEPDFPRTSTGKVLRREIARRIREEGLKAPAVAGSAQDLALDSLGRVELQARAEAQWGVSLDDHAVQNVRNEADLAQLIQRNETGAAKGPTHHFYRWPWHPAVQAVRAVFIDLIAMPVLRFLAKPRRTTKPSKLRIDKTPLLIVANHITSYDPPFVLYALPRKLRRRVAMAMWGEMLLDMRLARNQGHWFVNAVAPIGYWLITVLFNVFPLPKISGFRRSFAHAGEAVDRGYSVLVFPEGRRSDDGKLQPFKSGAGLLWKELGTPALPVRIDGLGDLKVRGGRWFRSGRVNVSVGPILEIAAHETPEQLAERLRQAVIKA